MTFKPEITIDGVAIVAGLIGICVWLGVQANRLDTLTEVVKEQGSMLKDHQKMIVDIELRNETTDQLQKESSDHENRIRILEKDVDFLKLAH